MNLTPRNPYSLWQIFRWPLLLGVLSLIGLIAALVGNGLWDFASWLCLGTAPVLLLVLYRRSPQSQR